MTIASLARAEIISMTPYAAAAQEQRTIRLNANELPLSPGIASDARLNRYPPIRPMILRDRLAQIYGVATDQLLVTRGSSEAIDLLIRVFCRPVQDHIVIAPPTFGMYSVYASIQQAGVRTVPLKADRGFELDVQGLIRASDEWSKLIFVCSPNNPTGNSVRVENIRSLLAERGDQSLVIVDEAYIEFSDLPTTMSLLEQFDNLVVLRTLSKAYGLAAARLGSVVAHPTVIRLLDSVMAPYAIATPIIEQAMDALAEDRLALTRKYVSSLVADRRLLADELSRCSIIEKVWPSDANFLLVRFQDLSEARKRLEKHRILIREYSAEAGLHNCARVTVGSHEENRVLLQALIERNTAHE